jgi:hypothetical protein
MIQDVAPRLLASPRLRGAPRPAYPLMLTQIRRLADPAVDVLDADIAPGDWTGGIGEGKYRRRTWPTPRYRTEQGL